MPGAQLVQDAFRPQAATIAFFCFCGLGKRQSRGSVVTPGAPPVISTLSSSTSHEGALSVYCRRLRRAFLVDSGADVSIFPAPPSLKNKKSSSSLTLRVANGSSIVTFGKKDIF